MASRGKRPHRVCQGLRLELAHPPCRLLPNRVEERRGGMADRGKRPRRVGKVLRVELKYLPCRLLPNRVEERRGGMASFGKGPRRVGQALRVQLAPTRQRRPLDLLPETPPRRTPEVQLCHGMRSARHGLGSKLLHTIPGLLSQGYEPCAVVEPEPALVRGAHFPQPAPAGGEMDGIEGLAILRMQIQQLPRARRFADE